MIETAQLILRPLRDADRDAFAALDDAPRISDRLGGPIETTCGVNHGEACAFSLR